MTAPRIGTAAKSAAVPHRSYPSRSVAG